LLRAPPLDLEKNSKSRIKWDLSLARAPLSPLSLSTCFALLHIDVFLFVLLLSFTLMFSSSCCCSPFWAIALFALLLFSSPYCYHHRVVVALLFGLLLFLHYCFFLHPTVLIIMLLLLSFLGYCSFCTTAFFFTLLFSSSCCCSPFRPPIFLFVLIRFPFHTIVFLWLFFYFRYKVFCADIFLFALLCFFHCAIVVGVLFIR